MVLLLDEKLTKLEHLCRAASVNGKQQLFVFLMSGGLTANSIRFDLQKETSGEKCDRDTLRTDGIVKALEGVLKRLMFGSSGFQQAGGWMPDIHHYELC